jgi:pyruvate/2-oxoglutarate dehydrogenase complex dihydrolipoamide dehydrogenase (E3) component
MTKVDRAVTEEDSSGFVKLIYQPNGKIIGATIVAGQAGEMVHDWSLAIDNGLRLRHVATSIHLYPTYSMAAMQIAATLQLDQLLQGHIGRLLRGLAKLAR